MLEQSLPNEFGERLAPVRFDQSSQRFGADVQKPRIFVGASLRSIMLFNQLRQAL